MESQAATDKNGRKHLQYICDKGLVSEYIKNSYN